MKLEELKAIGAVVSDKPIPREITFTLDDEREFTATIHVKRLSVGDQERIFLTMGDTKESRTARLICELVSLGDGSEELTFADAYKLHPGIAKAMVEAINEVNGLNRKNSQPPIDSSTISPLRSAV